MNAGARRRPGTGGSLEKRQRLDVARCRDLCHDEVASVAADQRDALLDLIVMCGTTWTVAPRYRAALAAITAL